jgi:hypothetical protein
VKRLRIAIVTAVATASLGLVAAPASACPPDEQAYCPPCGDSKVEALYRKLTGKELFNCWY